MEPVLLAALVAAVGLAGAALGAGLRLRLPRHHLDSETRELVKTGIAFLPTLTGIVLGLIEMSAEQGFGGVIQVSDRPVREALAQMQR